MRHTGGAPLALPLSLSLALHAGAIALLLFVQNSSENLQLQPYLAHLVAAPAGPREEGLVAKVPVKEAPKPAPAKAPVRQTPDVVKVPKTTSAKAANVPRKETATNETAKSVKATAAAPTQTNSQAATPQIAGGGPTGSNGADVVTAVFPGIEFSNQLYLNNIVNKIAKNFEPLGYFNLVAEFAFDIKKDGCIQNLKLVKGSSITDFDTEARVAIKKAAEGCGFQPLPPEVTDEILSIRFRFDPKFIKR